jgi:hypothetical protein
VPCFGGLTPFPKRLGGGKPRAKVILDSLNRGRGTGLDVSQSSPVYCDNLVAARAIAAAWGTNQRLANIWDSKRMTGSTISRWEKIRAVTPTPGDSDGVRRARLAAIEALAGLNPTRAALTTLLSAALGSFFVALEYISVANAVINVPNGSYPFGTPNTAVPWSSTVANILVRLRKPVGATEGQFYAAAGLVGQTLDPVIPAWVTFTWYRAPTIGAPVNVTGGPSAGGFYLDEVNLDNEAFDT